MRDNPIGGNVAEMAGQTVFRLKYGVSQIVHSECSLLGRVKKSPALFHVLFEIGLRCAVAGFATDACMQHRCLFVNGWLGRRMRVAGHATLLLRSLETQGLLHCLGPRIV